MKHTMRVKIHLNNREPFSHTLQRVHIQHMNGHEIAVCKKVRLTGRWIVRQYNNPVPCGEHTVVFPEDDTAEWEVLS